MNWFSDWFNSSYYHILYKERDKIEAQNFINNLVAHLQIKKGSRLIDIACGKGRHASYFNTLGLEVTGIDLSENSIKKAKKNENEKLHFFTHDMRKTFKSNSFNVATNLFTSFGYFDDKKDDQKAINAMAKNLKSDGLLIIDFMNVKKVISNLVSSEEKQVEQITFNITRKYNKGYIIKDIAFVDKNRNYTFQEKVRAITLSDFSIFIRNAGMKIINIFGSYELDNFNALTSDRLIIICKK
ncbi:MAG: SAM-dependent methyltransferase [Flavobacteriales bacterium]|nr:SAM-dependent methyltransferase [Flavobacteriales bacterium]|tara:strand:+ start:21449 stop:22171 length:723 start_codon:yes stop_codon:yes gene_type:complete